MPEENNMWDQIDHETQGETASIPQPTQQEPGENTHQKPGLMDLLPEWVTYETGDYELPYYREHALNFNDSKWFGRILRGFDGLTKGKLKNYWYFDVFIGIYQGFFEQNSKSKTEEQQENHEVQQESEDWGDELEAEKASA